MFVFNVTLADDATKSVAYESAETLLRYLTRTTVPDDVFGATLLMRDRAILAALDRPASRASMITTFEAEAPGEQLARFNAGHWALSPPDLPRMVRQVLDRGRFVLQYRPVEPLPARKPRK
jgi:hypothetical protein